MTEPRWLILETSGRIGQVALAVGNSICARRELESARRHARDLAPAVKEMLAERGRKARDLTGVIVGRGPGSYTGLRVGIISAKVFAFATGCSVIAVDTFAAVAEQAPPGVNLVDVISDAQQDKLYVQRFARDEEGKATAVTPLAILSLTDWLTGRDEFVWVTGPGLHRFRDRIPAKCRIVEASEWDPRADAVFRIGVRRYEGGERDDMWTLEPLYLRPSSAEEQWARRA